MIPLSCGFQKQPVKNENIQVNGKRSCHELPILGGPKDLFLQYDNIHINFFLHPITAL